PPSLNAVARSLIRPCATGARPKSTPVAIDIPSAKSRTDRSMPISLMRGTLVGYARISACTATRASHRTSMPPATHSMTPSVIVWRSSRLRLAPRAARTANSRRRDSARAISRFARFAHAISRKNPTATCIIQIERRASPTIASCTGSIRSVWSAARAGRLVGTWPVDPVQSRHNMEEVEPAVLTNSRRESERQPDCCVVVHDIDAGWHDPKDFVRPTVDIHGLSDEWLSSKDRLPQLVRNNRERWRQPPGTTGFFRGEEASLRRLNAKRAEQTRVDRYRPHAQRSTARREVD